MDDTQLTTHSADQTLPRGRRSAALGAGLTAIILAATACGSAEKEEPRATAGAVDLSTSSPAVPSPAPEAAVSTQEPARSGTLDVSGEGVAGVSFGTAVDEANAVLIDRLGQPDATLDPERYSRTEGEDGWYELAGDPLSLSWDHRVVSVSCWGGFCAIFGGDTSDTLALRGWELADFNRWYSSPAPGDTGQPDVRLEGSGVTLGDTWKKLKRAYPDIVSGGAEGGTLGVSNTPWPAIYDGAAEWRLSGVWDYENPSRVPADSVVTRLSGGEGPEPGCC